MPAAISSKSFLKITDSRLNGAVSDLTKNLVLCLNKQAETDGTEVFSVEDVPYFEWDKTLMHGLEPGEYVPEGADPGNDSIRQGHQIARATSQYGRGTVVTAIALDASNRGKISLKSITVDALAESRRNTLESLMALWYQESLQGVTQSVVNGRNVVDIRAIDSLSYFNAAHTWLGSGVTNSNLSTVQRSLTTAALQGMQLQARGWRDWKGFKYSRKAKGIVVGDNLIGWANVFLKSLQDPNNANNADNVLRYETGGGALTSIRHWTYMGADDFLMEFEMPYRDLQGTRLCFTSGCRNKAQDYWATNSQQAKIMEYRMWLWVDGDDPLQWITNRAAA